MWHFNLSVYIFIHVSESYLFNASFLTFDMPLSESLMKISRSEKRENHSLAYEQLLITVLILITKQTIKKNTNI